MMKKVQDVVDNNMLYGCCRSKEGAGFKLFTNTYSLIVARISTSLSPQTNAHLRI